MMDRSVLSALTNEQLKELPFLVASELITRGLVKSAKLGGGKYIVGKDIPVGAYKIKMPGDSSMNVIVHNKRGETVYNLCLWEQGEETGKLDLSENDVLDVNETCIIYVWSGVVWE